ncbi:MAG: large repetitive protein [Thermoanaerobaculia bacterium]|nr:large repetitive protein [Thermoanaerobaculia bacterium]
MALLALFAGCKGESPTAPPPITGTSGNGSGSTGGQPPVGANIALAVSTASPFTGSTSTITATVTLNNAPVPNGTAVEFATTALNANFTDTTDNPTTLIRTTTNGVAKATVTSGTAGPVVVTVTVNNVTKSVTLNFRDPDTTEPPKPTTPTIASISPATGLPTGNQTITITGTNFRTPVRVLFDPGNGQAAKEGFVTSVTPTQITVTTPAFDLGVAQQLIANITVIVEAGTPTEQRVTKSAAFTITAPVLTPVVRSLNPTSGPIDGGTRVTITGDAFEAAVQVFFGSAQAQVLNIQFHTIEVLTPTARDTNPNGSGAVTGPVDVRVLNVNSGKSVTATAAFRYVNKAQITAVTPDQGPFTGGTRVLIDGTGFNEPVTVYLDGIAASVIKVTPTEITAISNGIAIASCGDSTGPVIVTNVDNGDSATAPTPWIFRVLKPVIVSVSGVNPAPGTTVSVIVANAVGIPRILIGGVGAAIVSQTDNGNGTTTFVVQVPATLKFEQQACPAGGTAAQPTAFDVTYTSLTTTCTDTLVKGLTIVPPAGPIFTLIGAVTPFQGTITPGSGGAPTTVTVDPTSETVTIVNTGNLGGSPPTPLTVTGISQAGGGGTGCARFSVLSSQLPPTSLNQCESLPLTIKYNAPIVPTATPDVCTITINTNAGSKSFTLNGSSQ